MITRFKTKTLEIVYLDVKNELKDGRMNHVMDRFTIDFLFCENAIRKYAAVKQNETINFAVINLWSTRVI